jgi:hypothetical protein
MRNILKHFCFRLGLGMLVPVSVWAAGEADRPKQDAPPKQITRVVRADPRTGKLVRSVIVTAKPAAPTRAAGTTVLAAPAATAPVPAGDGLQEAVDRIAASQSVSPSLVHSVIKVESNYNPLAVSPKGAQGLMQLMPATARRFGVSNSFDPIDNVEGGTRYLKFLLDLYNGDSQLALAAYNAGEGAVEKYGSVPPYAETRNYLVQVNRQIQKIAPAPLPASKPVEQAVEVKPAGPAHIQEVVLPDGTIRYFSR